MSIDYNQYLKIRLDIPTNLRGPENLPDAPVVIQQNGSGTYNTFLTNLYTYLVSPSTPTSISGSTTAVINPNVIAPETLVSANADFPDKQGNWITAIEKVGSTWYGMVHEEGPSNYALTQTNKSCAMFTSTNYGATWTPLPTSGVSKGTIISSSQAPATGQITGEGDFTMIAGQDGMQYAYGGRYIDYTSVRARALRTNMAPGQWYKWYNGNNTTSGNGTNAYFVSNAINGSDTGFYWVGNYSSKLPGIANVAVMGMDHVYWFGTAPIANYTINGLTVSLANDNINFTVLHDPLVNYDYNQYNRPTQGTYYGDLVYYPILLNTSNGSIICDGSTTGLYYVWIPPEAVTETRYTILKPVTISLEQTPQVPNVGNMMGRYFNSSKSTYISSTYPIANPAPAGSVAPLNQNGYAFNARIAYFMTAPPLSGEAVYGITEGWKSITYQSNTIDDYSLYPTSQTANGVTTSIDPPAGYTTVRTTGWLFVNNGTNRVPVYLCVATNGCHFASTSANAEGLGTVVSLLGYALAS